MRKYILIIISAIAGFFGLQSCGIEDPFIALEVDKNDNTIEFVARPTSYENHNVGTKASSKEITDWEDNIYTAFFMVFDNDGNRIVFTDLTKNISENTIPSQTLRTDKGLSDAVVCFLANVSYASAETMETIDDLSVTLSYSDLITGCIGVPRLVDNSKDIDVYSIPMAGFFQGDLSSTPDDQSFQIPIKRLMSKIVINLSVEMENLGTQTKKPQFSLSNCVINNMPTKVSPVVVADGEQTKWAMSTDPSDYLVEENVLTYFNLDDGDDDSNVLLQGGEPKSLFFYVPEHIVLPDIENKYPEETRQRFKPTLFTQESLKRPLYVSILGDLIDENGNSGVAQYDIYLGANNYDNFSVRRNTVYKNDVQIVGTQDVDHRVNINQGDISVSFKRATYLDSHFEIRPIRIAWQGDDNVNGTVKIKVLDAYDDNAGIPSWIRLERPSVEERSSNTYCGSIGKRKYFTTDLVSKTLANNKQITYEISTDDNGTYPTWVYVDEYLVTSKSSLDFTNTFETFSDAIRQARVRVEYIPEGQSEPKNVIEYIITQRSVYPVVANNQEIQIVGVSTRQKYIYGIEYFEEYLYDYDDVNITNNGNGFVYDDSQNGMEWGLNDIQLSSQNKSIKLNEVKFVKENLLSSIGNRLTFILNIVKEILTLTVESASPYYDFYLKRENESDGKEYNGVEFNKSILNTLSKMDNDNSDINLKLPLNETPKSVIEYCYNKNKRNSDGTISTIHWYAPSIDEIEDIAFSAYHEFDVFQNELYWSCQPAYNENVVELKNYYMRVATGEHKTDLNGNTQTSETQLTKTEFAGNGIYYTDNTSRARATKVDQSGNYVSSGVTGSEYKMEISGVYTYYTSYTYKQQKKGAFGIKYWDTIETEYGKEDNGYDVNTSHNTNIDYGSHPGNQSRDSKHRVRCVYSKDGFSL